MQQLIEFIGNHPFLVMAFAVTLGMLLFTEYNRFFSGMKNLSPFAATQLLNNGDAVFLDVRDDAEFRKGHVIDARNIPVSSLEQRMHELEKLKDKDLIVYCDSGMRAQRAAQKLRKQGFQKLHGLAGGVAAWEKANLPLVTR